MSWDPLSEEDSLGSRITYLVRYRVHESRVTRNTEDITIIVEVKESSMIISELEPHLAYAVAVAAKNERGSGEFSDEIIADSEYFQASSIVSMKYYIIFWFHMLVASGIIFVASVIR